MNGAPEPVIALDPAWPRVSLKDATAALTAPGTKFEMETIEIRGLPTRIWKHAPHDLGVLLVLQNGNDGLEAHGDPSIWRVFELA